MYEHAMQQTLTPQISNRAADMPRSSIRRLFNAAQDLQAQGADVIRLDIGDPDFAMPQRISDAIKEALDREQTHYSPVMGLWSLREAVAAHASLRISRMLGQKAQPLYSPDQAVIHQGATQALNACMQLCCDRATTLLLPSIYFPNYIQQVEMAGIDADLYPLDEAFQPRLDALAVLANPSQRAMLINTPSNPTGALFPPDTVRALYSFAREHGLWIISDEAYADFVYDGEYLSPMAVDQLYPPEERRVFALFSFSKSYAATGLRMGYAIAPHAEAGAQLGLLNEPFTGSLTTPLQWGMLAALEQDDVAQRRESLKQRRDLAHATLQASGFHAVPPAGGLFYFLDISATGMDADEFADELLAQEQVAVVPGCGFGLAPHRQPDGRVKFTLGEHARRCVRLSFAVREDRLREGIARFGRFITRRLGATG